MVHSGSTSSVSTPVDDEKKMGAQVEVIHTNERVPGHSAYYEKDGLRTYGDDEDHDHEPPVCYELLSCLAMMCIHTKNIAFR